MKSLRFREKSILITVIMLLIGLGFFLASFQKMAKFDSEVMAAVSNPSPGSPGYIMTILTMPGNHTSGVAGKIRFKMPWPATLLGASAIVKTTGSSGAMTIDVTEAGTTVLSAPITVNASTVTEGTIADSSIADESMIGITTAVTAGTWVDPTVQLIFKRK